MPVGTTTGELRELTEIDLTDKLRESKEELFNLRFQVATCTHRPSVSHSLAHIT